MAPGHADRGEARRSLPMPLDQVDRADDGAGDAVATARNGSRDMRRAPDPTARSSPGPSLPGQHFPGKAAGSPQDAGAQDIAFSAVSWKVQLFIAAGRFLMSCGGVHTRARRSRPSRGAGCGMRLAGEEPRRGARPELRPGAPAFHRERHAGLVDVPRAEVEHPLAVRLSQLGCSGRRSPPTSGMSMPRFAASMGARPP